MRRVDSSQRIARSLVHFPAAENSPYLCDALRPARLPSSIPFLRSFKPYHGIEQMERETRNVFFSLACGSGSGKGCEAGVNKARDTSRGAGADVNAKKGQRFSANFGRKEAWTPMSEPEIRTQGRLRGNHRWRSALVHTVIAATLHIVHQCGARTSRLMSIGDENSLTLSATGCRLLSHRFLRPLLG